MPKQHQQPSRLARLSAKGHVPLVNQIASQDARAFVTPRWSNATSLTTAHHTAPPTRMFFPNTFSRPPYLPLVHVLLCFRGSRYGWMIARSTNRFTISSNHTVVTLGVDF